MKMGLLSLAIWTPIVFGAILLAMGRDDQARTVRWIALIGALAMIVGLFVLLTWFTSPWSAWLGK